MNNIVRATSCKTLVGTQKVLRLNLLPLQENLTMDSYDFTLDVYCVPNKKITINKNEMTRIDENNYDFIIDTTGVGAGKLSCQLTAYIADDRFNEGRRKVVLLLDTDIRIYNKLV